jgi:hypothetical protein
VASSRQHIARAHTGEALEREPRELEAAVTRLAAEGCRAHGALTPGRRIVAAEQGGLTIAQQQPAVLGRLLVAREEAARSLQPSRRDSGIAAEGMAVPDEPESDAGGAELVALVAVEPEGALAGVEGKRDVIEPPRREPEVFQDLRGLADGEAGLEVSASILPGSPLEGLHAGGDRVRGSGQGSGNLARRAITGFSSKAAR